MLAKPDRMPAEQVRDRLTVCRKQLQLFTRVWPSIGEWAFAVYTEDDQYVGCVTVGQSARVSLGRYDASKAQLATLAEFCRVFNGRDE
jgi:hypothetical protein